MPDDSVEESVTDDDVSLVVPELNGIPIDDSAEPEDAGPDGVNA